MTPTTRTPPTEAELVAIEERAAQAERDISTYPFNCPPSWARAIGETSRLTSEVRRLQSELLAAERRGVASERAACLLAVEDERLPGETGEPEDAAYNQAIDDALKAIRARTATDALKP